MVEVVEILVNTKGGPYVPEGGPWVVTMDGPGGTICSNMDGPAGPVIARTIYGVTAALLLLLAADGRGAALHLAAVAWVVAA